MLRTRTPPLGARMDARQICFVAFSGMLALALDDFTLLVVDTETRRVVRKFTGHHGNVNDMVGHWT